MAADALEKFSSIPTSQKAALLVILLVGIAAGWYFLFLADMDTTIGAARGETNKLNQRLGDANTKLQNLKQFEAEIEKLKRESDAMRDQLPPDEEIASLLQKIHGQGKIVGLEIQRFERSAQEPRELFVRIPVKMTLLGTFSQVTTFLYYVGKLTRIVNVENIELTTKDRTADNTVLQAVCTATTFMYRPDGAQTGGTP